MALGTAAQHSSGDQSVPPRPWPLPLHLRAEGPPLPLHSAFTIVHDSGGPAASPSVRLPATLSRFARLIAPMLPRGASERNENAPMLPRRTSVQNENRSRSARSWAVAERERSGGCACAMLMVLKV
jgi:hypothetical protein